MSEFKVTVLVPSATQSRLGTGVGERHNRTLQISADLQAKLEALTTVYDPSLEVVLRPRFVGPIDREKKGPSKTVPTSLSMQGTFNKEHYACTTNIVDETDTTLTKGLAKLVAMMPRPDQKKPQPAPRPRPPKRSPPPPMAPRAKKTNVAPLRGVKKTTKR